MAHPDQVSLNEAVRYANQSIADMKLPPDYQTVFGGQADMLTETAYYFAVAWDEYHFYVSDLGRTI